MKKLDVSIKDKNTLVLNENGEKGDIIDLLSIQTFDSTSFEKLIEEGKDRVYLEKIATYKKELSLENEKTLANLKLEYENKLNSLKNELESNKKEKESSLEIQKNKLEKEYLEDLNKLQSKIDSFELDKKDALNILKGEYELALERERNSKNAEVASLNNKLNALASETNLKVETEKLKVINEYNDKIHNLSNEITSLKQEKELSIKEQEMKDSKILQDVKESYEAKLKEMDEKYNNLLRQKSSMNVKQIGEDLEAWCDNEVKSYLQVGLENATWNKDNKVVSDEDGEGTKADYIFRIYSNELHTEELASVCLDMKDESPDSKNKQTNEHYYKTLDKNRNKKNCKYALLVSNLELDKPNALPMWRVKDYPDMYVVRPAYMMSFLSMLNSLTLKFKTLLNDTEKERLELISVHEFEDKFNELKLRYLDKPLESLEKNITNIKGESAKLRTISDKIDEECNKVINNYLSEIQNKLSRFDDEIKKAYRKYDKKNK